MATHSSSCLENPRDEGAWWATVSRVAQSQTQLKRLSSSSSSSIYIYTHIYIYIFYAAKLLQSSLTLRDQRAVAHQAPLSMGFFRQEHWSGLPCPPPEDLPDPHLFHLLHWQAGFFTTCTTWEAPYSCHAILQSYSWSYL